MQQQQHDTQHFGSLASRAAAVTNDLLCGVAAAVRSAAAAAAVEIASLVHYNYTVQYIQNEECSYFIFFSLSLSHSISMA